MNDSEGVFLDIVDSSKSSLQMSPSIISSLGCQGCPDEPGKSVVAPTSRNTRRTQTDVYTRLSLLLLACFSCISAIGSAQFVEQVTWIGGTSEKNMGTPQDKSFPATRAYHNMFLDSQSNNIYIFGGEAYQGGRVLYNDMWVFSLTSLTWTLFATPPSTPKDNVGTYCPVGIPGPTCFPPSRSYAAGVYDEANKQFYLFGGTGGVSSR